MHAVVNRIALREPIDDEVFAAAQRELPARIARIAGIVSFHVVRSGELELVVVILGEDEQALEELRIEVGNEWMRERVIPHAAGAPERAVGEAVVSYDRDRS